MPNVCSWISACSCSQFQHQVDSPSWGEQNTMSMAQNDWRPYWIIGKKKPWKLTQPMVPNWYIYIYIFIYMIMIMYVCVNKKIWYMSIWKPHEKNLQFFSTSSMLPQSHPMFFPLSLRFLGQRHLHVGTKALHARHVKSLHRRDFQTKAWKPPWNSVRCCL